MEEDLLELLGEAKLLVMLHEISDCHWHDTIKPRNFKTILTIKLINYYHNYKLIMVQTIELYLGSHVHKVVENKRGGLQGSPATASEWVWEAHAICMLLPLLLWCAGTGGWGQQTCVYQLDVVQPRQQVGKHYLPTIGMSRRKPLTDLCACAKKKKEKGE